MKITVLGAGLVGSAIIRDLAQEPGWTITAVDASAQALERLPRRGRIATVQADLGKSGQIGNVVEGADLVVCAVPGFMGFETLRRVILAGKNVVDISFFAEDAFELDELAKEHSVTAVVDCGVAPGLSNLIAGHIDALFDRVERYVCYVGGLPQIRTWPYEYKIVFSPVDVLQEYTRPARLVENSTVVTRPALTEIELLDLPGAGTVEAFNTDGLRSLMKTLDAPFMKEKTLRYPGHAELMRVFRETGLFDETPVEVNGRSMRPIDLTAKLLFEQWRMQAGDRDLTVFQVMMEGVHAGQRYRYTYDLLDRYDEETDTTSMARTTGYTCSIVARQVATGLFRQPGICPPEYVGRHAPCWEHLLAGYARRKISLSERIEALGCAK